MTRRRIAGAAAGLLLALILLGQSWEELPRRARFLAAYAPKELAVRRLGGSGTAFDRRFFSFLENARRQMPRGTVAVVLQPGGSELQRYLATFYLAPLPVYEGPLRWPEWPDGWIVAVYGEHPASDIRIRAQLPEGVLLGPPHR